MTVAPRAAGGAMGGGPPRLPLVGGAGALALLSSRPGARRDVQVGRREGRDPLHGQDAAGGRQQSQVELNKQGVPVKSTDPAPTAEQRRAKAQEEERQKQQAKEQAELGAQGSCAFVVVHERERDRSRAEPLAADDRKRRAVVEGVQRAAREAQGRARGEEDDGIRQQADAGGNGTRARRRSRRNLRARRTCLR